MDRGDLVTAHHAARLHVLLKIAARTAWPRSVVTRTMEAIGKMGRNEFMLSFAEIAEADLPELTKVMTRAFDDDTRKHLGGERGGPEGYDNGDFFRKWLFGYEETDGYKVLYAGRIVGGFIVWILPDGHNILGTIFVDPDFQDRGVGTQTWRYIEARYPTTKSWRLVTPEWATKNHHFYEAKCGFQRVEADPIVGSPEGEFVYWKETQSVSTQKPGDM